MNINNKKGQITFFIILGLILLMTVGVFLILNDGINEPNNKIQDIKQISPIFIENFIEACIKEVGTEGIYRIGKQGGYHDSHSEDRIAIEIPYYWNNGIRTVPTLSEIEDEISRYMLQNLEPCLNEFSSFKNQYNITKGDLKIRTTINQNDITINVKLPLIIATENEILKIDDFNTKIEIDFKPIYDIMTQIIEKQKETPNEIIIGYANTLAYQNNFKIEIINIGHDSVLYTSIFNLENMKKPFIYAFMARYNWSLNQDTKDIFAKGENNE